MTTDETTGAAAQAAQAHLTREGVVAYAAGPGLTTQVEPERFAGWQPQVEEQLEQCFDCGSRLRRQLAGPLPLIAAQTHFSRLRGTMSPEAWKAFRCGYGAAAGERLLLADRGDLAGLPAARRSWGAAGLAVGASLLLPSGDEAVLLAPDHAAYARLCQLLSRVQEEDAVLMRWRAGQAMPSDCSDLIALVRDRAWLRLLREAGAEAYWRGTLAPAPVPRHVPEVLAPVICHAHPTRAALAPVLRALRQGHVVPACARFRSTEAPLGLLEELSALADPERRVALERGRELLARCCYVPDDTLHLPPWEGVEDADTALKRLAVIGMQARYGAEPAQAAIERLAHELRVIAGKCFASYILTVYALAQQRRTCGRGSAASSMVCYCLGLTNVDPVRYQLVFERFLAPERTDPPDIDLDFPWDERDAVFAAALERYGRERVALVSTHLHFRPWSALREMARVHGQPRPAISAVKRALRSVGRFGGSVALPEPWPQLLRGAAGLLGMPRHYGLHPGGLVITSGPIRDLVPVHPAAKRIGGQPLPAIAWEKDGAEDLGLVKIDLLGNRSLAVVRDCLVDLREMGISIDEHKWRPQDDPATRRLIASGRSMGCFYIESPAMRQLNAKAGSGDFDRLVVHSSIIRPAANRWINEYLARLHHWYRTRSDDPSWYAHPALRGLLSQSFGILSYQEDVMLAARELAGFGSAEQNQLRKALGKTDTRARLQVFAKQFRAGCAARGVTPAACELVWGMISSFAGYSFCKAHSASYAMVSFQCAWLKAHHPAVFLARVIAHGGGFYSVSAYLEEARRHGIAIRGPCVVRSQWLTRAENACAIRVGLHLVPRLARQQATRIIAASATRAFGSFTDFWLRCRPTRREVLSLEAAGAFNRLLAPAHPGQRQQLITAVMQAFPDHLAGNPLQRQLLAADGWPDPAVDPRLPAPPGLGVLSERFRHLGFLPPMHPLGLWRLPEERLRCAHVHAGMHGRRVTVIGWCITRKQVLSESRDGRHRPMSFVTLEDESGLLECVWFADCYARHGHVLEELQPLRCQGRIQVEYGFPTLHVDQVTTEVRS